MFFIDEHCSCSLIQFISIQCLSRAEGPLEHSFFWQITELLTEQAANDYRKTQIPIMMKTDILLSLCSSKFLF